MGDFRKVVRGECLEQGIPKRPIDAVRGATILYCRVERFDRC
jgi:hypothetical protein